MPPPALAFASELEIALPCLKCSRDVCVKTGIQVLRKSPRFYRDFIKTIDPMKREYRRADLELHKNGHVQTILDFV